jgi:hypothetical protein
MHSESPPESGYSSAGSAKAQGGSKKALGDFSGRLFRVCADDKSKPIAVNTVHLQPALANSAFALSTALSFPCRRGANLTVVPSIVTVSP